MWHNVGMVRLLERLCKVLGALVLVAGVAFGYLWVADPFAMKGEYQVMLGSVASVMGQTAHEIERAVRPGTELTLPGVGRVLEGVRGSATSSIFSATE